MPLVRAQLRHRSVESVDSYLGQYNSSRNSKTRMGKKVYEVKTSPIMRMLESEHTLR